MVETGLGPLVVENNLLLLVRALVVVVAGVLLVAGALVVSRALVVAGALVVARALADVVFVSMRGGEQRPWYC